MRSPAQDLLETPPYSLGQPQKSAMLSRALDSLTRHHYRSCAIYRDIVDRVTLWGVTDGDSWLNRPGRANYPLLFDREGKPKPAFDAVIRVADEPIKP